MERAPLHYAIYLPGSVSHHRHVGAERRHHRNEDRLGEHHYAVGEYYVGLRFRDVQGVATRRRLAYAAHLNATDRRSWNEVVSGGRLA